MRQQKNTDIQVLEKFLKNDPANISKLMRRFKYTSSAVVFRWKERGLPKHFRDTIINFMEKHI